MAKNADVNIFVVYMEMITVSFSKTMHFETCFQKTMFALSVPQNPQSFQLEMP